MSYYNPDRDGGAKELWAVVWNGEILYTRGGSSTNPKLMVYTTEKKALVQLNRQKYSAKVVKIYG